MLAKDRDDARVCPVQVATEHPGAWGQGQPEAGPPVAPREHTRGKNQGSPVRLCSGRVLPDVCDHTRSRSAGAGVRLLTEGGRRYEDGKGETGRNLWFGRELDPPQAREGLWAGTPPGRRAPALQDKSPCWAPPGRCEREGGEEASAGDGEGSSRGFHAAARSVKAKTEQAPLPLGSRRSPEPKRPDGRGHGSQVRGELRHRSPRARGHDVVTRFQRGATPTWLLPRFGDTERAPHRPGGARAPPPLAGPRSGSGPAGREPPRGPSPTRRAATDTAAAGTSPAPAVAPQPEKPRQNPLRLRGAPS